MKNVCTTHHLCMLVMSQRVEGHRLALQLSTDMQENRIRIGVSLSCSLLFCTQTGDEPSHSFLGSMLRCPQVERRWCWSCGSCVRPHQMVALRFNITPNVSVLWGLFWCDWSVTVRRHSSTGSRLLPQTLLSEGTAMLPLKLNCGSVAVDVDICERNSCMCTNVPSCGNRCWTVLLLSVAWRCNIYYFHQDTSIQMKRGSRHAADPTRPPRPTSLTLRPFELLSTSKVKIKMWKTRCLCFKRGQKWDELLANTPQTTASHSQDEVTVRHRGHWPQTNAWNYTHHSNSLKSGGTTTSWKVHFS